MHETSYQGALTVSGYLGDDHRRLDALFADTAKLVAAADYAAAAARFAEFATGLDRHIEQEEQILFPVFEQATGMTQGPTTVMRHEHVAIRALLVEIRAAIAEGERARFQAAAQELGAVLGDHNMKEERILYPMTDRAAGPGLPDLVRRMQAF